MVTVIFVIIAAMLVDATSKPFAVAPQTMASMIKNLYELKPGEGPDINKQILNLNTRHITQLSHLLEKVRMYPHK